MNKTWYEVRTADENNLRGYRVETTRSDRKVAEQDVDAFKTLGKTAWIEETARG